jgi:hypothetical protein
MAGKLQGADHKTEAELISAGGAKADLMRDTQLYVSANSINKTLDDVIIDGDLLTATGTAVITNKDLDGGTASNTHRVTLPKASTATLSGLTRKQATIAYDTTQNKVVYDDGSVLTAVGTGSGGSSTPNYITNGTAETDTSGWSLFDDGAVSVPVDGTGGSSSTLTLTQTTTSGEILSSTASFKLAKSAANGQGEGVSCAFTVDRAGASTPTKISFNYQTTTNFSYANNDVVVYVYDVSASTLIQPTPYTLDGSGKFVGEFQTNSNTSTSYRLIFMVATTNATAYDFIFDNVVVYPNQNQSQLLLQDKQYTLSLSGTNSFSTTRAVGVPYKTKDGTWRFRLNLRGTISSASSGTITVSGVTAKNVSNFYQAVSITGGSTGGTADFIPGSSNIEYSMTSNNTSLLISGDIELDSVPTITDFVDYYPVSLSDGAETRVAAARITDVVNGTSASSFSTIVFQTKAFDTHSAYSTGTGLYTVPITGKYKIGASVLMNTSVSAGNFSEISIYQNNSQIEKVQKRHEGTVSSNYSMTISNTLDCIAGDTLDIRVQSNGTSPTLASGVPYNQLDISRISGPATIAASEKVYAEYTTAAGQTMTSATDTTVDFGTKVLDSHGAVTVGGSWVFTAPKNSEYIVLAAIQYTNTSRTAGFRCQLDLHKNGSKYRTTDFINQEVTGSKFLELRCHTMLSLNAGDTIRLIGYQDAADSLVANATYNWITIRSNG